MSGAEMFLVAAGLSMDAFAVAVCQGLGAGEASGWRMAKAGLWFGGFQALMPLLGYYLGTAFAGAIAAFDHWIAFGLLAVLGANMVREACSGEEEEWSGAMFLPALATSIDALAVGVTLALLPDVDIGTAVLEIGGVTFFASVTGVRLGAVFGAKYRAKAEWAGGLILIGMGVRILVGHLWGAAG